MLFLHVKPIAAAFFLLALFLYMPQQAWGQNVIITGFEDYNMGTYNVGSGDQTMTATVCVGKDAGDTQWDLTADGSGIGGTFTLDDGAGNTISFNLDHLPATPITAGVPITRSNADNTPPLDCGGVDNQSFRVRIPGSVLDGAPAGTYTGYVDLTAAP